MADSTIGRSDGAVRPSLGVERAGSATDHQHRGQHRGREQQHPSQQQPSPDRREPKPPNPLRRRIYDLLFEEIDDLDALSSHQKTRIKDNIRAHLTVNPPAPPPPRLPSPPPLAAGQDEEALAHHLLADPGLEVNHDDILDVAAPVEPHLTPDEAMESARLARQFRECLTLHSERARKVAVYLHLLLYLHPADGPHMVLDV